MSSVSRPCSSPSLTTPARRRGPGVRAAFYLVAAGRLDEAADQLDADEPLYRCFPEPWAQLRLLFAALRLFQEAAHRQELTIEKVRELAACLRRAATDQLWWPADFPHPTRPGKKEDPIPEGGGALSRSAGEGRGGGRAAMRPAEAAAPSEAPKPPERLRETFSGATHPAPAAPTIAQRIGQK